MFDLASSTSLCLRLMIEPLVVVVDGDREHLLGVVLADHVVVEDLADFLRRRNAVARLHQRGLVLLADDVHAQFDAFVADEHGRAGDELAHLVLALAAERAVERVLGIAAADFAHSVLRHTRPYWPCAGEALPHQVITNEASFAPICGTSGLYSRAAHPPGSRSPVP